MTGFFWVDDEDEDKCLDNILIRFIACYTDVRKHVLTRRASVYFH